MTAFVTPFGKYEFLMVPFGLAQAPAYFQLLMSKVLKGLSFAMTYLDDIIIFSNNELDHLEHLEIIFHRLTEAGLKMKHSKCGFFKNEIHYLGYLISADGIRYRSATKRFNALKFEEQCCHFKEYLRSPETFRTYPYFIVHKWDKQNFRKKVEHFTWNEHRQKLFHAYNDQFNLGNYKIPDLFSEN